MHLIIIANPAAGNGKATKIWPMIEPEIKRQGWKYKILWSEYAGHSIKLVQQIIHDRPELIIALGGDGTVHEVIAGMYEADPTLPIPFTVYPIGTGNDWARYWNISSDVKVWSSMIAAYKIRTSDLGEIEYTDLDGHKKRRVFNNVAGAAYDAYVADIIQSNPKAKGNKLIYFLYIFKCLFGYKLQKSKISFDNQSYEDHFYTINIGVCPYSGGGLRLVPHAQADDGLLALTAVKPLNKLQVFLMSRHFYTGRLHLHKKVISANTPAITMEPVDPNEIIKLEADGEVLGKLPARFVVIKNRLKVLAGR